MEILIQDIRYALRGMRRAPGFTAAAILTLALGMGATTAIFSVIRAVLLSPLPYAEPERRVAVWSKWVGFDKTWLADGELMDYRRMVPSFESVAGWDAGEANLTGGEGEAARVGMAAVTANTFATLGARPQIGRAFTDDEDRPGGAPVAVLGYGLWQNRYGGDPDVLEKVIELDGVPRRVVGVMPRGFALPTDYTVNAAEPSQVWIPLQIDPKEISHGNHGLYAAAALVARRDGRARHGGAEDARGQPHAAGRLSGGDALRRVRGAGREGDPRQRPARARAGVRRGPVPAADGVRERGQPPARAGGRPGARDLRARRDRRGQGASDAAAADRELRPRRSRAACSGSSSPGSACA